MFNVSKAFSSSSTGEALASSDYLTRPSIKHGNSPGSPAALLSSFCGGAHQARPEQGASLTQPLWGYPRGT